MTGEECTFEGGYIEAVAQTQLLMNYLRSLPALSLQLETRSIKIGHFEFTLSRQLTAVYAFFLLEFNGFGAEGSMGSLFEKRTILAELERQIDRFRKARRKSIHGKKLETWMNSGTRSRHA